MLMDTMTRKSHLFKRNLGSQNSVVITKKYLSLLPIKHFASRCMLVVDGMPLITVKGTAYPILEKHFFSLINGS